MTDKAIEAAGMAVAAKLGGKSDGLKAAVWNELAQAAISAYLTQREADGFVMVPMEPSEAMHRAGCEEMPRASGLTRAYRAMIAARPQVKP